MHERSQATKDDMSPQNEFILEKSRAGRSIETESRLLGARKWGGGWGAEIREVMAEQNGLFSR